MEKIITSNNKLQQQYCVYGQNKYRNFDNGNTRKIANQTTKEKDLKNHTLGEYSVSYTFELFTNIFGLDIDVKGAYLSEDLRSRNLVAFLEIIKNKLLGIEPSILFKSRQGGGIHCYYKLDKTYPFNLISNHLNPLFKEYKNIEILPTPNKPLRFPFDHRNGGMIVDFNLKPITPTTNNYDFLKDQTEKAPTYNFNELFVIPTISLNYVFDGKGKLGKINSAKRLDRYNKYYLEKLKPKQGQTNDYLSDMSFNGFVNVIPAEIVIKDIASKLDEYRISRDIDLTEKRITERVTNHYKRLGKKNILEELRSKKKVDNQLDLIDKYEDRINKIFDEVFPAFMAIHLKENRANIYRKEDITKRRRSLRKFLRKLLEWGDYINSLTNYERQVLEIHYKGFYKWTKDGATPLPFNLMRKWYSYYYLIIKILLDKGYLTLKRGYFNPYQAKEYYSDIQGISNYFDILF